MPSSTERFEPMVRQMDPAVSWVADTLDYEPLAGSMRAAAAPQEDGGVGQRFWCARALLKVASTVLMAAATGITAAALQAAIEAVVVWRNSMLQLVYSRSVLQAYGVHLAFSCGLAAAGAAAVQLLAPRAAGGGVPWVMAFLNGNDIHGLFSPLVFLVKLAGSTLAMGAGLCLGVEAPMVHLGACLSSMASNADRRVWSRLSRLRCVQRLAAGPAAQLPEDQATLQLLSGVPNRNADRREMISAGAAAGIAAAFGAPIGGVMFAWEEAASHWSRRVAWRCFLACAVAVFTHSQLNPHAASGLLSAALRPLTPWQWLQQLPLLAAVGGGGGLLGAAFNKLRLAARPLRPKPKHHAWRVGEVVAVAGLTVTTAAVLAATVGRCVPVPEAWLQHPEMWVQHSCPEGQHNDVATLWLGPPVHIIRSLISLGTSQEPLLQACTAATPCYCGWVSQAAMCAAYLPLFVLSAALAIPGGLFMPSLLLGGVFGALCGSALRAALPVGWHIEPGLYALCGATAVLGGVFRTSISLAVLMIEATGSLAPLFGVIVAVVVSNAVSLAMGTDGVYESELEASLQLNYLAQQPPRKLLRLTAEQLMSWPVKGLPVVAPVDAVQAVLRRSQHNGFPVFDQRHQDLQAGTFRLDGFILRSQLELLLENAIYCDQHGRYLHQPRDPQGFEQRVAAAMAARLQHHPSGGPAALREAAAWAEAAAANGSSDGGDGVGPDLLMVVSASGGAAALEQHPSPFDNQAVAPHLNLAPYLNRAPVSCRLETPATRVHAMFVGLSLRHIVVVDERNHACGIITRRDLAHAAGSWLGRGVGEAQQAAADMDSLLERPLLRSVRSSVPHAATR